MPAWRDVSIPTKLTVLFATTAAVVLILAVGAFVTSEVATARREAVANLASLADVVGYNAAPALAFDDPRAASDVLRALRLEREVVAAAVYDARGVRFSEYSRAGGRVPGPRADPVLARGGHRFRGGELELGRPVFLDEEHLGSVLLRSDLGGLRARLRRYAWLGGGILAGALVLGYLLSRLLQRSISSPILRLAQAMESVSETRDYTVRVPVESGDELGALAAGFNGMLEQIRRREAALEAHRERLEEEVRARTAQLRDANRRLEETVGELRRAKEAAEASSRSKSRFLASISHEVRTPMNGVLGMVDLLARTRLDETQRRYLDTVRRSGETLLRLIDDLLDIARIEAGKVSIRSTPFHPREVVDTAVDMFQAAARKKGIELKKDVDERLPGPVLGDPERLGQVLHNLLDNAVKFTERGAVSVRVSAGPARGEEAVLEFAVSDTGPGIPPGELDAVFRPFSQVGDTGGLGLGLAISRELVERMGGRILVTAEPEGGTIFRFTVRVREAPPRTEPSGGRTAPAPDLSGARILVVEDVAVNREVALGLLEAMGCRAQVVGSGREAVEALASVPYDLVLMDCELPGLDGFEATRRIRNREETTGAARVPIVAMTAYAASEDKQRCMEAGMDDYVAKPIRWETLAAVLTRWLDRGRAHSSPGRPPAEPVLDVEVLERIRSLGRPGKPDLLPRVVQLYLEGAAGQLRDLEEAAGRGDGARVAALAHALKSGSANVGAARLATCCARLEALGRSGGGEGVGELLERVRREFAAVRARLRREIQGG